MLAEILNAVSRTAIAGLQAYAQTQPRPRKKRKKGSGCTPCDALKNAERIKERASEGQL